MGQNNNKRDSFGSNLGFLLAAIGSAVGLGNLWGFPYKMGANGGFAFLILYLILVVFTGYILTMTELSLGRKTGKSIIPAYKKASDGKMTFVGWFSAIAPFLILGFYSYLGGIAIKYMVANFGDIFHAGFGVGGTEGSEFFVSFFENQAGASIYTVIFMLITIIIVAGGLGAGIEKFNKIGMPALFGIMCIIVIRSCTLPGASDGLSFILKPDFTVFTGKGWIHVLAAAGGQMFFSLSLGMGIMVTYGSYLSKEDNIARSGIIVPLADTLIALMAGFAIMPAVFAFGMEPGAGPGLLFMTLQNVFNSMGAAGAIFGCLFYLLVVIAALSSSISLLDAVISSYIDAKLDKGGANPRKAAAWIFGAAITVEGVLVAFDGLGTYFPPMFGKFCWLDGFDLISEGLLMPIAALITVIYFGWVKKGYLQEEIANGSEFKAQGFYTFCLRFIAPLFCLLVLLGQIDSFFGLGWF